MDNSKTQFSYKEKIKRNFSRAAVNYDLHATFQKEMGELLIDYLKDEKIEANHILDLGTGTGFLLEKISKIYPESKIYGFDIAPGMIEIAKQKFKNNKNIFIIEGDIESPPFQSNYFDLVISNLSLQWVKDLESTFEKISVILKPSGFFYFNILGGKTFCELKTSLESLDIKYPFPLIDKINLEQILKKIDFTFQIEKKIFYKYYPNLMCFLKKLKQIGAGNVTPLSYHLGQRTFLRKLEEEYCKNFAGDRGIKTTYEAFLVTAQKPCT